MQCFSEAADTRPKGGVDENIIHNCIGEVREASYDAEAAFSTFVVKIAFRTCGRSDQFPFVLKRYLCIFKECLALREVRLEIEAINTRITNSCTTGCQICGILNSTGVGESSSSTSMAERQQQLRRSYTHIVEEDVVGTEEDVKTVVDLLVKEKMHYRVVSIRGMGDQFPFPFVLKRYLCIFKECLALREVRLKIEAINTKITNSLTTGFQTCGILNSTGVVESSSSTSLAERQLQLRRSYTHIVEEDVVGTEEDVKAVVDLLVKENTNYRVVSIWGMGGLGKTTLAKTVYKHIEIRRHFKCVAWAYVSQQCNTRDVLVEILIKLLSPPKEEREEIEKSKHHDLVKKLHQVQSEKKCLVILDDIWKDADWDSLSPGFPNTTEVGSKILLTTRNENVAKHVDQQCVLYKLRHLTDKESWELFEKTFLRRNEGTVIINILHDLINYLCF
ncbi:hypothetical protein CsSME_00009271 [Camellia sinensis var. sinensis]